MRDARGGKFTRVNASVASNRHLQSQVRVNGRLAMLDCGVAGGSVQHSHPVHCCRALWGVGWSIASGQSNLDSFMLVFPFITVIRRPAHQDVRCR
jgi:hypothetical protein